MLNRILVLSVVLIVLLLGSGWLGLQVKATSFPLVPFGAISHRIPLPTDLPAPVERFARVVYGENLPEVQSAMVLGRARLAPTGIPMPTRFRFYYDAATSSYYHDIQVTWFTLPFLRIHERNLEGHSILDLALLGQVEDEPHINQSAIQGYWAEVLAWVPSIALTDPRVRWEEIDADTARLYLPELDTEAALTVHFDADTGLISEIETQRYQDEKHAERSHWNNAVVKWGDMDGLSVAVRAQTQWDNATPWATWEVEQVVLNVDVATRMAQFGGDVP